MNVVVFEHVPVAELPQAWRAKLALSADARVTVRIEAGDHPTAAATEEWVTEDSIFGMWRERDDMSDVAAYIRRIRAPRFNRDGSRNELP